MKGTKPRVALIVLLAAFAAGLASAVAMHSGAADEPAKKDEEKNDLAQQLIGTWQLEEASRPGTPSGIGARLKMFTGTHWCIVQPDPNTGVLIFQHGGRYRVEGNKVHTTRDFAGESTKSMIGGAKTLTLEVNGDTMKQVDADGVFNETWKRVK